jgi:hypothetical protein
MRSAYFIRKRRYRRTPALSVTQVGQSPGRPTRNSEACGRRLCPRISHTSVMATGLAVGGDAEQALGTSVSRVTSSTQRESSGGSIRPPNGFSAMFAVATSPPSSRQRTAGAPPSSSPGRCWAPPRPRMRPPSWFRPPVPGCPWRSARCRSRAANGWSASSGCSKEARTTRPQRRLRTSPPVRSRCFSSGAGPLDEADRRRAPREHRDGQKPHPPSLSRPRRPLPARSRRRRPGRITVLIDAQCLPGGADRRSLTHRQDRQSPRWAARRPHHPNR